MKKKFVLVMLLALPLFMASCSKDDGDWDRMKWKTEVKTSKDGYINVPPEGVTLTFWCVNYNSIWLCDITESVAGDTDKNTFRGTGNLYSIKSNWMTAKSEGNKLTITIEPTTSDGNRFMEMTVENGDAFDTFKIKQRGLKVGL
mgnify:CR=1 FL=1